jgi:hypothetical protein
VGTIVAFEDKRNPARSMVQLDERILEHIESEGWATPKILARERGFPQSEGRITDRCKRLHYCGFLDPHHGEMYDITVEGRLYLKGDLDARHQPTPKASAVFERWSFPADWSPGPVKFRMWLLGQIRDRQQVGKVLGFEVGIGDDKLGPGRAGGRPDQQVTDGHLVTVTT